MKAVRKNVHLNCAIVAFSYEVPSEGMQLVNDALFAHKNDAEKEA